MDPNSMPKSSKSTTRNYNAKGRANHEHLLLFFLQGSKFSFERRTQNTVLLLQNRVREVWQRSSVG